MEDLVNAGVRRAVSLFCYEVLAEAETLQVENDDLKTFSIVKVVEVLSEWSYRKADRNIARLLESEGRQSLTHMMLEDLGDATMHQLIEHFNRCCQLYSCEGELAGLVRTRVLRSLGPRILDWASHARRIHRVHVSQEDRNKTTDVRDKKRMLAWSLPNSAPSVHEIRVFLQTLDEDDEGVGPAAAAAAAAAAPAVPAAAPAAADAADLAPIAPDLAPATAAAPDLAPAVPVAAANLELVAGEDEIVGALVVVDVEEGVNAEGVNAEGVGGVNAEAVEVGVEEGVEEEEGGADN